MIIKDELYIIKKERVPAGTHVEYVSIRDKSIRNLVNHLNEIGLKIDLSSCEKEIQYRINRTEKQSMVPFRMPIGQGIETIGYILRNNQLELILRDHYKCLGGRSGIIGGDVRIEDGVHCLMSFDGSYEEARVLEDIKEILNNFYRIKQESILKDMVKKKIKEVKIL